MNKHLATYLTLKMPTCTPAQTSYDHEEWARFYLELLTDPEYQKYNVVDSVYGSRDLRVWSDSELIFKARQHVEAAKLLTELDSLHGSNDTEDGSDEETTWRGGEY